MQFNSISFPLGVPHGAQRDILLMPKKKKKRKSRGRASPVKMIRKFIAIKNLT